MLTLVTQTAIAVLYDIASGNKLRTAELRLSEEDTDGMLHKLERGGFIERLPAKKLGSSLWPYKLCHPLNEYSLLELLEAIDEPIYCNNPIPEAYYMHHGVIARKMGVINHMTRHFLSGVKLTDW